jgi:hypothetical protein
MNLSEHEALTTIWQVADTLRRAERLGADKDEPEGVRYIQMSDSLAWVLFGELVRASDALLLSVNAPKLVKRERPLTRWIMLVYQAYMGLHGEALRGPGRLLREALISMLEHRE